MTSQACSSVMPSKFSALTWRFMNPAKLRVASVVGITVIASRSSTVFGRVVFFSAILCPS